MKESLFFAGLAAATLALVGCNKEADVRGLDGVPVGIVLSNVDTRTVNDGMATKWEENDALNVFYAPAGTQTYSDNTKFVVDDADANHATGTADLTAEAYDWYLLYPYESHIKTPANTNAGYLTVGSASNKTQTQAGLNSTAHLAGKNLPVYGVAKNVAVDETPSVSMKHVSSVVAVNLTNATDQPLTVSSVSFTAPEDIVGTYYIDFSGDALGFTGSGTNYVSKTATLNVTGEEALAAGASAKFYIAVKPFAAKVGDKLAVKVVAGDVVFEKEITLPSAVEFKSGMIKQLNVSYDGGSEIKPSSLTEIAAMDKGANIQTNEVLVVAKYARGVMLAQDGFYLLAFNNNGVDAKIGDIVTVSGEVGEYAGLKQIANPVVEVISSDNEVVLPEPKVLEGLDDYASEKFELIQYSGTMAVSGNYFNVNVDGSTRQGSIQYPLDADAMKALDKKLITATGFFTGITGSGNYVNMMSTSVEEKAGNVFDATPTQINVAATATSAEINVTGNVDWTAEASTGATLDKTSGTGEAVITVSFPANEDQQNTKEYTVFVRTEATGVNDEIEINITQAKAVSSDEPMFVKVTASSDLVSGKYLIVSEEGGVAMKDAEDVGGGSNTISVTPADGMIAVTDALKAAQFTFDLTEGFIQGPNGKYIGQTSDANGMKVQDTGIANEISVSAGDADIISGGAHLRYNANAGESNLRFRYYKSASYTNQKAIQLYKLINDGGDTPPVVATLVSIAVSGQKTVFTVGEAFVFDGKVTATYSDGTTKTVSPTSVSEPNMTTAGTKEVTVSYTEGEVTATAKYDITVNAASAHAGTVEDPYSVADAMAATEALGEGKTSSDSYYTKGVISEIVEVSPDHGNATYFISDDGTTGTQFKVFRGKYIGSINFTAADQIKVGDEVVVYGKLTYYKPSNGGASEIEVAQNNYIYSLKRNGTALKAMSAVLSQATVASAGGNVTVNVYGNVDWTASATSPATLEPASGSGIGTITVKVPENTTDQARTFTVTVAAAGVEPVVLQINQNKKEEITGKVDVLNQAFTGVTGTSYADFSGKEGESGAVYAGQCAGGNESIQLRSNNNNSGVVTTASGGKVKKVTVTWNSNTAAGRTLNIYGKNEAYAAATDLYDNNKQGTLLGTIVMGTSIELDVTGDYQFIGFRSASGAMYLTEVQIVWE
jgi:hypothetical protein